MTSQRSFNSEYFVSHVLAPMLAKVFPGGRITHTNNILIMGFLNQAYQFPGPFELRDYRFALDQRHVRLKSRDARRQEEGDCRTDDGRTTSQVSTPAAMLLDFCSSSPEGSPTTVIDHTILDALRGSHSLLLGAR
jgi:hypothetical protein